MAEVNTPQPMDVVGECLLYNDNNKSETTRTQTGVIIRPSTPGPTQNERNMAYQWN